jgi:phosphotriesterase-related protein
MTDVMTVLGPVDICELGVTLVHEHVAYDATKLCCEPFHPTREHLRDLPVTEVDLALLRRDPLVSCDNCRLTDLQAARRELSRFAEAGGRTVIDVTTKGLGPSPASLRALASDTEIQLIAGTGYYLWSTLDQETLDLDVGELTRRIVTELGPEGIDGTCVRAGVIGEIGTSSPLHAFEERVLRAAAAAHKHTGASISVHLDQVGREGERILDILLGADVPPQRIVLCHVDQRPDQDHRYLRDLAASGVFLGFDTFGTTFEYDSIGFADPTDGARIDLLIALIDGGLGGQLLLSHDVGLKCMLRELGGGGYAHLLVDLVPVILDRGVDKAQLEGVFVGNVERWLGGAQTTPAGARDRAGGEPPSDRSAAGSRRKA